MKDGRFNETFLENGTMTGKASRVSTIISPQTNVVFSKPNNPKNKIVRPNKPMPNPSLNKKVSSDLLWGNPSHRQTHKPIPSATKPIHRADSESNSASSKAVNEKTKDCQLLSRLVMAGIVVGSKGF